jgi:hypothetical protein
MEMTLLSMTLPRGERACEGGGGAVAGGDQQFLCERYIPAPAQAKTMSDKQIKSLLKNIKKGY